MDLSNRNNRRDERTASPRGRRAGETAAARANRLAEIRLMIEEGSYETEERWEAALEQLFADVSERA